MKDKSYYDQFILKEYEFWELCLHEKQFPYIGRCYAWAKRENAKTAKDMHLNELIEVHQIIYSEWNKAIYRLLQHNVDNFSIMCNEAQHLHVHFIPRYESSRTYKNLEFTDQNFGHNYAPYQQLKLSLDFLMEIKEDLQHQLNITPNKKNYPLKKRKKLASLTMSLFDKWQLEPNQKISLLCLDSDNEHFVKNYKENQTPLPESKHILYRVGALFSIHKSLKALYPKNPNIRYNWVNKKNKDFKEKSPLDIMTKEGYNGIRNIKSYLKKHMHR